MPVVKLTAAKIRTLATEQNDELFLDETLHGFAVRVRATGAKTFAYYYKRGGKTRRCKIGTVSANVSDTEVAAARKTAKTLAAQVQLGGDPAVERQQKIEQAADTFGNLVEKYLEFQKGQVRESTLTEIKRHLENHAKPLHKLPLYAVDQKAVADRLNAIAKNSGEIAANRVRANLSAMFGWAMGEGLAKLNPVAHTNKRKETPRDRVLTGDELRTIWNATGTDHFGVIVKVLLLTGQRRNEIAGLRWEEIDFDKGIITLPTSRTKNDDRHTIPMSDSVHDLVKGVERKDGRPFVFGYRENPFSGFSKSKIELDKATGKMERWTLHDLRRTAVTGMANLGIEPHYIEAIVNHKSGHQGGVAGIYNHAKYEPHKAAALTRWADHVAAIVASKHSNVTPLKKHA